MDDHTGDTSSANDTVYLVLEADSGNSWETKRIYQDRAEAEAFIDAHNAATGWNGLELEEMRLGAPAVEYDGPLYIGTWTTRRKLTGEVQLVLVNADGFTTVVPSAVPTGAGRYRYHEMFAGPTWRDLAPVPDYEEPPVWIDSFYTRTEWHTGDFIADAELLQRRDTHIEVRGTSKEAVEQMLREVALEVKSGLG